MLHAPALVRCLLFAALPVAALPVLSSTRSGIGSAPQEAKPVAPHGGHPAQAWHVLFEMGPKYDPKLDAMAQPGFADHFQRVHKLADEGKLLVGGPLLEDFTSGKLVGAVMVMTAKDEKEVRDTLNADSFISGGVVKIASVRPFMVGAGAWMPKEKAGAAR